MENKFTENNYLLSSVNNALRILKAFTVEEPERGIRELAQLLEINKSTVQRLLVTLSHQGFVIKDPATRKYRLGVSILGLSNVVTSHLEVHKEALPVLKSIVEKTGETVHMGILEGTKFIYMHKVEPKRSVRIFTEVGKIAPCHCTSGGKAILAYQDGEIIESVINEGLTPYTKNTITDPQLFRDHLKKVKENGYALTFGELIPGESANSVAAPIRDYTGKVFASISLVGPSHRLTRVRVLNYVELMKKAANEISRNLGY